MIQHQKKYLILCLTTFLLLSCGNIGHSSFNKRKFTNLKIKTSYPDQTDTDQALEAEVANSDLKTPVNQIYPQELLDDAIDEVGEEILTEQLNQSDSEGLCTIESEKVQPKFQKRYWKKRRDFNSLSKTEQTKALIEFNRLFNIWIPLFIFGVLGCGIFALLLTFPAIEALVISLIVIGIISLLSVWIMSLISLNKLRKIDIKSQSKRLRVKFRLCQVAAYIGIAVCVVSIIGGVLFGILWATRVISI